MRRPPRTAVFLALADYSECLTNGFENIPQSSQPRNANWSIILTGFISQLPPIASEGFANIGGVQP